MRPLTDKQKSCLRTMRDRDGWYWGCGWMWDNRSGTIAILDGLVKRGLAEVEYLGKRTPPYEPRYKLTSAGLELADELYPARNPQRSQ